MVLLRVSPLLLAVVLPGLIPAQEKNAPTGGKGQDIAAKLDADLASDTGPIFVRMKDQLLPTAGAFEAFCAEHAGTPRSTTRRQVIADLQARSAKAMAALKGEIDRQTRRGGLRDVTPFFLVNGFAATADPAACRAFAARDDVEFVYRQRGPGGIVQHRQRGRAAPIGTGADLELALKHHTSAPAGFKPEGLSIPWNLQRVQADEAWRLGATGKGVVVAVLDTGLLPLAPLTQALWRNPGETLNGRDDDGNGYIDDIFGYDFMAGSPFCIGSSTEPHGTMCAGIIAGRPAGEPRTVTGVAPEARLMILRGGGLLRAYEYALLEGADVLSMSYMWIQVELGNFRGVFRTAHEHLAAAGMLSLGGAGNFGRSHPEGRQIATPKDIPCVLAVAGILEDGSLPPFSSRGPVTWDVQFYRDHPAEKPLLKPDLTACNGGFPVWGRVAGARVTALQHLDGDHGLILGPRGNSFAGPHVAGVAALVWSVAPDLQAFEVAEILLATAKGLGPKGPDTSYGHGLVQAARAVEAAKERGKKR